MIVDNKTTKHNLPLPSPHNELVDDVLRLIAALGLIDIVFAPLESPELTGAPKATTAAAGDNSLRIATTAFVAAGLALKANKNNAALTGAPTAPTPELDSSSERIATTAFVAGLLAAGLATKLNLAGGIMTGPITFDDEQEFPPNKITKLVGIATTMKFQ